MSIKKIAVAELTVILIMTCTVIKSHSIELCSARAENNPTWRRLPNSCTVAYVCILGKTVTFSCPAGFVVYAEGRTCVLQGSDLDTCNEFPLVAENKATNSEQKKSCTVGEVVQHDMNCAKYFQCVPLPDGNTSLIVQECTYPLLFVVQSGKCEHFKDAKCEPGQDIPKSPCDYDAHRCTTTHCIPCNIRFPSCTGLPDGTQPWTGREWSPYFVNCEQERVILQGQCKSEKEAQVFHPNKLECVVFEPLKLVG